MIPVLGTPLSRGTTLLCRCLSLMARRQCRNEGIQLHSVRWISCRRVMAPPCRCLTFICPDRELKKLTCFMNDYTFTIKRLYNTTQKLPIAQTYSGSPSSVGRQKKIQTQFVNKCMNAKDGKPSSNRYDKNMSL